MVCREHRRIQREFREIFTTLIKFIKLKMRKLLLLAIAALALTSCTKDEYLIVEEGAVQVIFNGSNPFDLDGGTEVGFNLVPVGNSTSGKGVGLDFNTVDPKAEKRASSARVDSNFEHIFGTYTVELERVSTGQRYSFEISGGLTAANSILLPEGETINYTITSANTGQFETTLPLTGDSNFVVPESDVAIGIDLSATTNYALVTMAANLNVTEPPTFAGTQLVVIPAGNAFGEGAYIYANAGITGQVSGTWSMTVSETAYGGEFASAEFTTAAYNHYHYELSISYQVVDVAGNGATSVNFTIVLDQVYQQTNETINVSFDIENPVDEDHVFSYNILVEDLVIESNAFGQVGFDDAQGLVAGTQYIILDQDGNNLGVYTLNANTPTDPYNFIFLSGNGVALGSGTYDIAEN